MPLLGHALGGKSHMVAPAPIFDYQKKKIQDSLACNFRQVGPTIMAFLRIGSFNRIFSTKMEYLGKLIFKSQTATPKK